MKPEDKLISGTLMLKNRPPNKVLVSIEGLHFDFQVVLMVPFHDLIIVVLSNGLAVERGERSVEKLRTAPEHKRYISNDGLFMHFQCLFLLLLIINRVSNCVIALNHEQNLLYLFQVTIDNIVRLKLSRLQNSQHINHERAISLILPAEKFLASVLEERVRGHLIFNDSEIVFEFVEETVEQEVFIYLYITLRNKLHLH